MEATTDSAVAKALEQNPTRAASPFAGGVTRWAPLGIVVAGLVYLIAILPYAAGYGAYRMTLLRWLEMAWGTETWQHGALAPVVAAFLVWRKRDRLAAMPARPAWSGFVLMVGCLLMYWIGYRGNFYYIGYTAIQFLLAGIVLWIWGWAVFWQVGFAWLMLAFAWPYLFLEDTLSFKLRYLMVTVTAKVLNVCGIGTLQDGTALVSAATPAHPQGQWFSVHVDGPCSGMRSLFALMMVSAVFGYFRQRSAWRRCFLFALSLPLAVLANMVRICVLVLGAILFGQEFAIGKGENFASNFHIIAGFVCFLAAVAFGLMGANKLLNRVFGEEQALPFMKE